MNSQSPRDPSGDDPRRFRAVARGGVGRGLPGPTSLDLIPGLVERGKRRAAWFYEELDKRLGESEYLGSDRYTAADVTAQCAVDFGNAIGMGIPEHCKNVARWHAAVSSRPSAAS